MSDARVYAEQFEEDWKRPLTDILGSGMGGAALKAESLGGTAIVAILVQVLIDNNVITLQDIEDAGAAALADPDWTPFM